ncbi:MAG: inositol monophosphatase family protein [Pseudomonadota bacterium]
MRKTHIIETAHALADAARTAILPWFRASELHAESKDSKDFDPVTQADRAAEAVMRDILALRCPDDAIIGEEFGRQRGTSGLTWVLDPIDGTRGFVAGTPTWGVLISVADDTGPIYGIIDQPYIGERFEGGLGMSQVLGPLGKKRLSVRGSRPLSQSVLFTTFPRVGTEQDMLAFQAVSESVRFTRYGMDCYAYALLAAGQLDLVIEAGLSVYDIQAPIAVIEAAGGIVTDWLGGSPHQGGRVLAAAGKEQHEAALEILSSMVEENTP